MTMNHGLKPEFSFKGQSLVKQLISESFVIFACDIDYGIKNIHYILDYAKFYHERGGDPSVDMCDI